MYLLLVHTHALTQVQALFHVRVKHDGGDAQSLPRDVFLVSCKHAHVQPLAGSGNGQRYSGAGDWLVLTKCSGLVGVRSGVF